MMAANGGAAKRNPCMAEASVVRDEETLTQSFQNTQVK
jgi:hypothetical protein